MQAHPTDEPAIDQLAFDSDRYQRATVPVTISGQGPYRFFIDTGAQATVVSHKIVNDLQLQPSGRARVVAMGSVQEVDTVELDELRFANRTFNGLTSPLLRERNLGADGILGLDSLQDLRVLIDFQAGTIEVADASLLGGNSGYEIVVRARRHLGQMIITNARINGVRTAVIIDTGAQNSIGNLALRKKLRGRDEEGKLISTDVHGVSMQSNLYLAGKLSIGGLELRDVPMGFAASPVFASLGLEEQPTLILGMQNLQIFERVAIDFANQRVLFDIPGSTYAEDIRKRVFFPTRLETI
ncbi:MAG: retroviral-like aspartic protease family protein [Qipengyuania sp.]